MSDPFRRLVPGEKLRGIPGVPWNAMMDVAAAFRRGKVALPDPPGRAGAAGFPAVVAARRDSATADGDGTVDDDSGDASGADPDSGRFPRYAVRRLRDTTRTGDGYADPDPSEAADLTAYEANGAVVEVGVRVWARLRGPGAVGAAGDAIDVYEFDAGGGPGVTPATVTGSADYGPGAGGHWYSWAAADGSGAGGQENATAWLASDEVNGEPIAAGTPVLVAQTEGDAVFRLWRVRPPYQRYEYECSATGSLIPTLVTVIPG